VSRPLREILADAEGRAETYTDDFVAAIHEAAHAYIAKALGVGVDWVDLIQTGDRQGVTRLRQSEAPHWADEFHIILAGPIAESLLGDPEEQTALAMHYRGDMDNLRRVLREAGEDPWSPRVVSLIDETRAMVKSNWPMIEKIARLLLREGCLYEEDIEAAMGSAP